MKESFILVSLLMFFVASLFSQDLFGDIIISGDFETGNGQVAITNDISFEVTLAGAPRRILLDEFLTFDGSIQGPSSNAGVTYAINGVNQNTIFFQLFDGGVNVNDSTENDLHLSFFGPNVPTLSVGDTFTIRAATLTGFSAAPGFNSTGGTAEGIFLTTADATRISPIINSVPEPSSSLLFLFSSLAFFRRRRA